VRKAGVEAELRHHDANAVPADDAQQMGFSRIEHVLLQRAAVLTEVPETRGNDNGGACPVFSKLADQ
jgi:hypothetical protein